MVALLANVPALKLLVTSRETLNLREGMAVPGQGHEAFPEQDEVANADFVTAAVLGCLCRAPAA